MSDKQLLLLLLDRNGIKTRIIEADGDLIVVYVGNIINDDTAFDEQSDKVKGHPYFFTKYVFDIKGALVSMGAYE